MTTKYRVNRYGTIEKLEITRETEKMVFYRRCKKEERELKSSYSVIGFFDSFDAAKQALIRHMNLEITKAEWQVDRVKDKLEAVMKLEEPQE